MAVGVEGQYLIRFNLGGNEDFILEDDLIEFAIIEDVGNVLPSFQLAFNTQDDTILALLNENNDLQVSFGKDRNSLVDATLKVIKLQSIGLGADKKQIMVAGLFSAIDYSTSSKLSISESKSALEIMQDVAKVHFSTEFNVEKSRDLQRWIQPNSSDKKFVNELWLHSDLGDSFPAVGISSDGRFIMKDIKASLAQPFKWRFTKNIEDLKRDVIYDDDYVIDINSGFVNSWVGYGREKVEYNLEDDVNQSILETIDPIMALSKRVAKDPSVGKRFASTAMNNENIHDNYWSSFQHNVLHLAALGTVRLTFSFQNRFVPIRVLDLVMFRDTNSNSGSQTAGYHSGLYFVCKVARSVSKRQFVTTVVICRESLNELKTGQ